MSTTTSTAAAYQGATHAWRTRALKAESALKAQLEIKAARPTRAEVVALTIPPAPPPESSAFAEPLVWVVIGAGLVIGGLAGFGLGELVRP